MNDKKLVVKSNHLIESRYKLPVIAQKVLLGCAMKVRSTDEFNKTLYTLSVDEYEQYFGINSNASYEHLREAVDILWNSSFYIVDDDGVEVENRWIISRKRDKRKNYVGIKFHEDIKDFIYQLTEQFTSYKIENIAHLRSIYSIRLYELMKQYEKIGWREIDYKELRLILSIGDGEYILFGDFNRRILKQAQREIKDNTDIDFEYTKLKEGRKVKGIKFTINKQKIKRELQIPGLETPEFNDQELYDKLISFGASPSEAEHYFKKYPVELIERNLKYCEQAGKEEKIKTSKRGYLRKSIELDFAYVNLDEVKQTKQENENRITIKKLIKEWKNGNKSKDVEMIIEKYYQDVGHPLYQNWRLFV
jgi:plasmid replication initiation protein